MLIRKANQSDHASILKLLSELNTNVSVDRWKPFFNYYHSSGEPYYGYLLEINGSVEGFIGTVISDRNYNGSSITCCNIHGWIVREQYKQFSLKLLTEVLKNDMIFTCFSAMELTQMILKRMKFFYMEHNYRIYRPALGFTSHNCKIETIIFKHPGLSAEENKIIEAHKHFKSVIVLISNKKDKCLLVFKPEQYLSGFLRPISFLIPSKYKQLLKIDYIGNKDFFNEAFKSLSFRLMLKLKCLGFILKQRESDLAGLSRTKKYFGQRPYMYRFDREKFRDLEPDVLFSEMFVLNHKG